MIDKEIWNEYFRTGVLPDARDMIEALDEKFTCPRCGRPDLPLALFPHHDNSCIYECGIGMPPLDKIEQLQQRVDDLEDGLKEALRTIMWFGAWLNNQKTRHTIDDSKCANCGHMGRQHTALGHCSDPDDTECECNEYRPSSFSINYDARGVARLTGEIYRLLGIKEFHCRKCHGKFDMEHRAEETWNCKWCNGHSRP